MISAQKLGLSLPISNMFSSDSRRLFGRNWRATRNCPCTQDGQCQNQFHGIQNFAWSWRHYNASSSEEEGLGDSGSEEEEELLSREDQ